MELGGKLMKTLGVFHNRSVGPLTDKMWQLLITNIVSLSFSRKLVLILCNAYLTMPTGKKKKKENVDKGTGEI